MNTNAISEWEQEFKRIRFNPIYFIENFYNQLNKENPIILTDEEKQKLYDKYRGIPLIKGSPFKYSKKIEKLREEGYRDWEIF
jgi:hypothetical protein